jgi:hypothetical protein
MRRVGDYLDEMGPMAISDTDIERILRGQTPNGPGLTRLVSIVDELRGLRSQRLRSEVVSRHVTMAAEAVREALLARAATDGAVAARTTPPQAAKAPRWILIPRFGTSLATFALLVGMTGVAVASDAAVPGDTLHGFDLALEKIGVGAGGAEERISEARELANGGMPVEALDHASTALDNEQGEASDALKKAAERLKAINAGNGYAAPGREEVAEFLNWMASHDVNGKDYGKGVAERAKELGNGEAGFDASQAPQGNQGKGGGNSGNGRGR